MKFPFVTTAHWVFNTGYGLKYITDWGEKTVAVSEDIKTYLMDNYHIPSGDINVTINGIDTEKFSPKTDCEDIKKELGIKDDGEPCVCPQSISYSLNCKWFRTAVLPNDKELYIKLMKPKNRKKCTVCGNEYTPTGRNSKYCDKCRRKIRLRKDAERKRNKRSMSAF